jgi:branched-chain amino acid transport system substrate-binding protein
MVLIASGCGSGNSAGGTSTVNAASTAANPALLAPFPKTPAPSGGNGGATATGVTATTITTGDPISASGSLPGATLGAWLGVKAYFQYVNESGGVYGRKLISTRMETGFDANQGEGVCQHDIPQMFALVGTVSNVDTACLPLVKSSGIPWVGFWNDPGYGVLPNVVSSVAGFYPGLWSTQQCAIVKAAYPSISKVAVLWINVAGIGPVVAANAKCWQSVGVKVVYSVGTDPQAPNMTPYVIQARSQGANVVDAFGQDVTNVARIAQAMQQQGFKPTAASSYAVYDARWHGLAGPGAAGWVAVPFWSEGLFLNESEMNKTKGGALFYKYWRQVNGNTPIDTFGIYGFQQAAYFVQGLLDAGPHLTRAKLLTALKAIKNWDNLGTTAPVHWLSPGKPSDACGVAISSTATGYTKIAPPVQGFKNGFICPGKYIKIG